MEIELLTNSEPACEGFLQKAAAARLCHTFDWSHMLTTRMGYPTYYLVARGGGEVCGVMPLTHLRSRLFGNRMISQAFSNYGGGVVADDFSAMDSLFSKAREMALQQGCSSIEFRTTHPMPYELHDRTGKVCMHLPLSQDPEAMWQGFRPKIRNLIKKAFKNNLQAIDGGMELIREFYDIYSARMGELGTPCYPRKIMEAIVETFPANTRLFVVRMGNKAVAAAFTFEYKGFAEIPWAASVTRYNGLSPNNLLYWAVISYYCRTGAHTFDFGRSSMGGATYEFKRKWGTQAVDLHYQYWVAPGHKLQTASPDNPKYRFKVDMWKKLPLWTTRLLGPVISRQLP